MIKRTKKIDTNTTGELQYGLTFRNDSCDYNKEIHFSKWACGHKCKDYLAQLVNSLYN